METLVPAAVMPSGFPRSATVRPAIGPRFSTGGPRTDVTRYAFARSGSNSCCGLATVTQPNIVQGSVAALCACGATAMAAPGQYGAPTNNSAASSCDACVRCERRTVLCLEALGLVAASRRRHVLRIADTGIWLASSQPVLTCAWNADIEMTANIRARIRGRVVL